MRLYIWFWKYVWISKVCCFLNSPESSSFLPLEQWRLQWCDWEPGHCWHESWRRSQHILDTSAPGQEIFHHHQTNNISTSLLTALKKIFSELGSALLRSRLDFPLKLDIEYSRLDTWFSRSEILFWGFIIIKLKKNYSYDYLKIKRGVDSIENADIVLGLVAGLGQRC